MNVAALLERLRLRHLALFGLLLLAYRAWAVQHSGISLFVDEAYYWGWSRDLEWGYYSKPPMVALLIRASTALFGDGVLGVKLLAMALFPLTALVVTAMGREMFGARVGMGAGLLWSLAFASGLLGLMVTTDALLLCFWTLSAWLGWRAMQRPQAATFALLGLSLGLGVLSKYTMLAFAFAVPWMLWRLWRRHGGLPMAHLRGMAITLAVMALLLAPHALWNVNHGAPTVQHTVDITLAAGETGGWAKLLEFWAGQWLMISPVPMLGLLLAAWGLARRREACRIDDPGPGRPGASACEAVAYLLALALPLLAVASVQAYHARANMNWAAPSFVPLTLLFCLFALRGTTPVRVRWWSAALLLNLVMGVAVVHAQDLARLAGKALPTRWDVFARMRAWDLLLDELRPAAQAHAGLPVLGVGRTLLAHAVYHWRERPVQPLAWNPEGRVQDHYQLKTDLPAFRGQDLLLLVDGTPPEALRSRFEALEPLQSAQAAVGPGRELRATLYLARGFKGYAP